MLSERARAPSDADVEAPAPAGGDPAPLAEPAELEDDSQALLAPASERSAADDAEDDEAPVPYVALATLCIAMLAGAMNVTILFPFLPAYVDFLGVADSEDERGYYAGVLAGAFMIGRVTTSFQWGKYSDVHGRKPVIMAGTASLIGTALFFGLCTNFYAAVAARTLTGMCNGVVGVSKAATAELCPPRMQARALSLVGMTWGMGLVLGPIVGGLLAEPVKQYPDTFAADGLFGTFPFLLPMLVAGACALAVLPLIHVYLPNMRAPVKKAEDGDVELAPLAGSGDEEEAPLAKSGDEEEGADEEEEKEEKDDGDFSPAPPDVLTRPFYTMRGPVMAIGLYTLWSVVQIVFDEVYSLFCAASPGRGGMGMSSAAIGSSLAMQAGVMVAFQIFVFPPLANWLGAPRTMRCCATLQAPMLLAFPFVSQLPDTSARFAVLVGAMALKNCLSIAGFTSCFMLINNSVPTARRGAINGLAMMVASLGKGVGPMLGGAIFAWSESHDLAYPLNYALVFNVSAAMCVAMSVLSVTSLPASLGKPMRDP